VFAEVLSWTRTSPESGARNVEDRSGYRSPAVWQNSDTRYLFGKNEGKDAGESNRPAQSADGRRRNAGEKGKEKARDGNWAPFAVGDATTRKGGGGT